MANKHTPTYNANGRQPDKHDPIPGEYRGSDPEGSGVRSPGCRILLPGGSGDGIPGRSVQASALIPGDPGQSPGWGSPDRAHARCIRSEFPRGIRGWNPRTERTSERSDPGGSGAEPRMGNPIRLPRGIRGWNPRTERTSERSAPGGSGAEPRMVGRAPDVVYPGSQYEDILVQASQLCSPPRHPRLLLAGAVLLLHAKPSVRTWIRINRIWIWIGHAIRRFPCHRRRDHGGRSGPCRIRPSHSFRATGGRPMW